MFQNPELKGSNSFQNLTEYFPKISIKKIRNQDVMLEESKGMRSNKCIKILYWETIDCTLYLNDNFSEFYTTLDIWVFVRTWRQHFFYFYAFFSFQRAWQPGNTSAKPTCRFVSRRRRKQHFQRQFHLGTSAIQV